MKNWKFDTIAVHGLYTMQDAIEDYQGSIIEPIFMSTAQAFRDSDEMAAALAYMIPSWSYSRIANPSTYYYEWVLALLEGYGFDGHTECCSTSSGGGSALSSAPPTTTVCPTSLSSLFMMRRATVAKSAPVFRSWQVLRATASAPSAPRP